MGERDRKEDERAGEREGEAAEKPVKPRQEGPPCRKVKGERKRCVREEALCSVTQ